MDNKVLFSRVCNFTNFSGIKKDILSIEEKLNESWNISDESDLSHYDSMEYVLVAYISYVRYSKSYIKMVANVIGNEKIDNMLDYGAGIGATTLLASELFNASCYYLNLKGKQWDFAETILQNDKCKMIDNIGVLNGTDLIWCLDLFEHIREPIALLKNLLSLRPKYLITSNSFAPRAYGHFSTFIVDNTSVDCSKIGRVFNRYMKESGYVTDERCKHPNFWNTRPRIWKRIDV